MLACKLCPSCCSVNSGCNLICFLVLVWRRGGRTHDERTLVVLLVLLKEEDIDAESRRGVEEGKDADGDKELGRGRVVANQEDTILVPTLTGGRVKVHLVESDLEEEALGIERPAQVFSLDGFLTPAKLAAVAGVGRAICASLT